MGRTRTLTAAAVGRSVGIAFKDADIVSVDSEHVAHDSGECGRMLLTGRRRADQHSDRAVFLDADRRLFSTGEPRG